MKNAIIGCITQYYPKDIQNWVESLNDLEIDCDKVMLLFNEAPKETVSYLEDHQIKILHFEIKNPIVVDRFLALYQFLLSNKYDYVLTTDVKDVVFQSNPFDWLKEKSFDKIVIGSESISCNNMPWSNQNYSTSFPMEWDRMKDEVSFCAGVIAGKHELMLNLFLQIWRLSIFSMSCIRQNPSMNPDQAALNLIAHEKMTANNFKKCFHSCGFVSHLSIPLDEYESLKNQVIDSVPKYDDEGFVYNENSEFFCIVHQYDRVDDLKEKINKRYVSRAI